MHRRRSECCAPLHISPSQGSADGSFIILGVLDVSAGVLASIKISHTNQGGGLLRVAEEFTRYEAQSGRMHEPFACYIKA